MLGSADSEHPRLTNREIIFEVFEPKCTQQLNVTDRQTDRVQRLMRRHNKRVNDACLCVRDAGCLLDLSKRFFVRLYSGLIVISIVDWDQLPCL